MEVNKRLKCYYIMQINPKAFAIPILTLVNTMQSELGIANALRFILII